MSRRAVESMSNGRATKDSGLGVALAKADSGFRGCLSRTAVCILRRQKLRGRRVDARSAWRKERLSTGCAPGCGGSVVLSGRVTRVFAINGAETDIEFEWARIWREKRRAFLS